MVRRKQSFAPETVQLLLKGPRSILVEPVLVAARPTDTWYELLNLEMGLEVTPDSGIFVCTRAYTPSDPKDGVGWRSGLNDRISDFVNKYERKRSQYCVRLYHPDDVLTHAHGVKSNSGTPGTPTAQDRRSSSTTTAANTRNFNRTPTTPSRAPAAASKRRPNLIIPTQGTGTVPNPTPSTSAQASRGHTQSQKPRNNFTPVTNGLPKTPNSERKQQPHSYGTRQKRLHEQTVGEITLQGSAAAAVNPRSTTIPTIAPPVAGGSGGGVSRGGSRNKRGRFESSASTSTANAAATKERFPLIANFANLAAVKIESVDEPADPDWAAIWDEPTTSAGTGGSSNAQQFGEEEETNATSSDSGQGDEDDEDNDTSSLCTAVTAEENELRREGIQVEDVFSLVKGRMPRFSNAYLLRVRNEIRKLRENKLWDRNVSRAPLGCYLLAEMFKE